MIKKHEAENIHPTQFAQALKDVKSAREALVNISELAEAITAFEAVNENLYTDASYAAYKKAVDEARELLVDGSKTSVISAVVSIENARKQLIIKDNDSLNTLNELIAQLENHVEEDYTSESYSKLQKALNEVKSLDLNNLSSEQLKDAVARLDKVQKELVSVKTLHQWMEKADKLDQKLYTKESYAKLLDSVEKAKIILVSGTAEAVSQTIVSIEDAILNLAVKANADEVKAYVDQIVVEDASKYISKTYEQYEDAYHTLIALSNDLDNLSVEQFNQAKTAFETAYKNLVIKDDTQNVGEPSDTPSTNDNNKLGVYVGLVVLSTGLMLVLLKKSILRFKKSSLIR